MEHEPVSDVEQVQKRIEHHFRRHAGSVSRLIIPEAKHRWLSRHPKRLATVSVYVRILSSYIRDENIRSGFQEDVLGHSSASPTIAELK